MVDVEPWGAIEKLLLSVGSRDEDIGAAVDAIGLRETAAIVCAELVARCDPPALDARVQIQLVITHGAGREGFVVGLGQGGIAADAGWAESAIAQVTYEATDLVRRLFSVDDRRPTVSRDVHVRWQSDFRKLMAQYNAVVPAVDAILSALSADVDDLNRLALRYESDKWGALHWYTPHYREHFDRLRNDAVRVLEIGVGGYQAPDLGGGSLRMWQRYFRRGLIYGLDIFAKPGVTGPRMRTIQGDQSSPRFLRELGSTCGPFDIVIDDGSHVNEHVLTSFRELFPCVRPGGYYAIEDLQTSYWPMFGGSAGASGGTTTIGFLKTLLDGLHYREYQPSEGYEPTAIERDVVGLHVYHNLAIIEKGGNLEEAAPSWIPRDPEALQRRQ